MKTIFVILGVLNLIIWGFDYKHDYDYMTWLWFVAGILFIILSYWFPKVTVTQQPLHNDDKFSPGNS